MKSSNNPKWRLRYYGDPVLRQKCEPVEEITDEIKELAKFMMEYADNNNGIGLSAIQVGVPIRMFVLRDYIILPDGEWTVSAPKVFINPKIISKSDKTWKDTEGCMSIPDFREGPVERPYTIMIEATDIDGNRFTEEREWHNARVTLHENDHLNGVLFVDRLPPKVKKKVENDLRQIKKKYSA